MPYGRGKRDNEYAQQVFAIEAPKTVWMAIAYSFALRLHEGNQERAAEDCYQEWGVLHANGIVPQKPRRGGA